MGTKKSKADKTKNIKIHEPEQYGQEPRYTKEFAKLQSEWYGKLQDSGFDDLEYVGSNRLDPSVAPLKTSAAPDQKLGDLGITYHYYNILQNYLTHCGHHVTLRDRTILKLYCEGIAYRKICTQQVVLKHIEQGKYKPYSYGTVFQTLKRLKAAAMRWNKQSKHGLDTVEVLDAGEDAKGGEA